MIFEVPSHESPDDHNQAQSGACARRDNDHGQSRRGRRGRKLGANCQCARPERFQRPPARDHRQCARRRDGGDGAAERLRAGFAFPARADRLSGSEPDRRRAVQQLDVSFGAESVSGFRRTEPGAAHRGDARPRKLAIRQRRAGRRDPVDHTLRRISAGRRTANFDAFAASADASAGADAKFSIGSERVAWLGRRRMAAA